MIEDKTEKWWEKEAFARKRAKLEQRSVLTTAIRKFFSDLGFCEVETPILQVCPGMEVHTKVFETVIESHFGRERKLYLHTSPEFAMKKLLVAGMEKIFQITKVFRNAEASPCHYPEFSMIEWYRINQDYRALMKDCDDLLKLCAELTGRNLVTYNGKICDISKPAKRVSVVELFAQYTNLNLYDFVGDGLNPDSHAFFVAAEKMGINVSDSDRWDDIFFKIFMERIEPYLGVGEPTIVYDYPVCMAALSRKKPEDCRFAERFELYVSTMEMANAFSELTDASEQRLRFEHDFSLKKNLYGKACLPDEDFLLALESGMPQSTGIALGIDRLMMLVLGAENIEEVLWTPLALP